MTSFYNEIRGTGAGRMYTLFYEPTTLADVDPTDGSIATQVDVAVSTGTMRAWSSNAATLSAVTPLELS